MGLGRGVGGALQEAQGGCGGGMRWRVCSGVQEDAGVGRGGLRVQGA